jgi:hypothetical protein
MLRVEAKDDRGQSIETNPQAQAKIIGVSFEGVEPIFLVGDATHQDKITMRNIIRVEESQSSKSEPGIKPVTASADKNPNFITFQKGVGSSTFGPGGVAQQKESQIRPEVARALESYQVEQKDKGFPNGLKELDERPVELQKGGEIK